MSGTSAKPAARIVGVSTAWIVVGIVAIVLAVLAVLVVRVAVVVGVDNQITTTRGELRDQASPIVADVMSVDVADSPEDRARARSMVAGDAAASMGAALTAAPSAEIVRIRWEPTRTSLVDAGTDWGETLLAFDVTTTKADAPAVPVLTRRTLAARFERIDGRWLLTRAEVVS